MTTQGRVRRRRLARRVAGLLTALAVAVAVSTVPEARAQTAEPNHWLGGAPLDIAHAGGDLEAPHSTPFAFAKAVQAGADMLELDVALSADGVPMVHHDDTVDRITNATGRLDSFTAAELHELDAAYWFVPNCWSCHGLPDEEYEYRGIRTGDKPPPTGYTEEDFVIPTLESILQRYPDQVLDIEIKGTYPEDVANAQAIADLLAEYGRGDSNDVIVASFDDALLAAFKAIAPHIPTSPGLNQMIEWFANRGPMPEHQVLQVPRYYDLGGTVVEVVTPQFVADAHAAGLAVWVWFAGNSEENPDFYTELLDMGVDGLLTGKPALVRGVLDARPTFTARYSEQRCAAVEAFAAGLGMTPEAMIRMGVNGFRSLAEAGAAHPVEDPAPNDGPCEFTVTWSANEATAVSAAAAAWGLDEGQLHAAGGWVVVVLVYLAIVAAAA